MMVRDIACFHTLWVPSLELPFSEFCQFKDVSRNFPSMCPNRLLSMAILNSNRFYQSSVNGDFAFKPLFTDVTHQLQNTLSRYYVTNRAWIRSNNLFSPYLYSGLWHSNFNWQFFSLMDVGILSFFIQFLHLGYCLLGVHCSTAPAPRTCCIS